MQNLYSTIELFTNLSCTFASKEIAKENVPDVSSSFEKSFLKHECNSEDQVSDLSKSQVHSSNLDNHIHVFHRKEYDEVEWVKIVEDRRVSNRTRRKEVFRSRGFETDSESYSALMPYPISCIFRNDSLTSGLCFKQTAKQPKSPEPRTLGGGPSAILCEYTDDFDLNDGTIAVQDVKDYMSHPIIIPLTSSNTPKKYLFNEDRIDTRSQIGVFRKLKSVRRVSNRRLSRYDEQKKCYEKDKWKVRSRSLFDSRADFDHVVERVEDKNLGTTKAITVLSPNEEVAFKMMSSHKAACIPGMVSDSIPPPKLADLSFADDSIESNNSTMRK
eukprot:CAMPEP_0113324300 /NCGR_PEP_ID=MMETSP0010_2-20120614/16944_1 /TAXON_ID=216773 ORGANISM="Corethron hystrix, Strain 308" /NCGR_SAMPLE_ID=MMETSP0010_2 /ASSEMBLY_ACC=CAM_ASM_000155 /LENGTH=328 /DNA_ID=CAMNT_0000183615 /DNA_START=281 /DNA_END=1267 /DNA_ORIENTATION=+ /assembly_acc=CAM_ASM_000155